MEKGFKNATKSLILILGFLLSCNSPQVAPENITVANANDIPTAGISIGSYSTSSIPNGKTEEGVAKFLIFKDEKTFEETVKELNGKGKKDLDAWEQKLGFVSMRNLFENVVDTEVALRDKEEFLSKEQQQRIIKNAYVTDLAASSLDFMNATHENGYTLKIYNLYLARLVDRRGIVQIGKEIQLHGEDVIKVITDGDASKIAMLFQTNETDKSKGIEVRKVNVISKPISTGRTEAVPANKSCEGAGPSYPAQYKVQGYDNYSESFNSFGQTVRNTIDIYACKRGFLGFWYNYSDILRANGSRYLAFETGFISGNFINFSYTSPSAANNWSWNVYSNTYLPLSNPASINGFVVGGGGSTYFNVGNLASPPFTAPVCGCTTN